MRKSAESHLRKEQIISFSDKTSNFRLDDLLQSVEPNFRSTKKARRRAISSDSNAFSLAIIAAVFAVFGITAAGTIVIPLVKGSASWAIWQLICAVILIKAGITIIRAVK